MASAARVWFMDANGENARVLTRQHHRGDRPRHLARQRAGAVCLRGRPAASNRTNRSACSSSPLPAAPCAPCCPTFATPSSRRCGRRAALSQAAVAALNSERSWRPSTWASTPSSSTSMSASGRTRQLTDGQHFIAPGLVRGGERREDRVPAGRADALRRRLDAGDRRRAGNAAAGHRPLRPLERDFALPRQEKVEWKSADGTTIEGMLFYPLDYQPGRRYPLVVQLHSGPMVSDNFGAGPGLVLELFPGARPAKGYAVLRPELSRQQRLRQRLLSRRRTTATSTTWRRTSCRASIIWCRRGIADPDRLIAMGWSAGGTLVNKLVTMTNRFKAASSGAGIANWMSLYGADRQHLVPADVVRRHAVAEERAIRKLFWNSSPLKDVANAKTPTLFFAGENDPRVPMPQSVEMYRALSSHNVPTHLHRRPARGARLERAPPSALQGQHRDRVVREVRDGPRATSSRRRLSRNPRPRAARPRGPVDIHVKLFTKSESRSRRRENG